MRREYLAWIEAHVIDPLGACAETTSVMQVVFPELKRVRGHYFCPVWGEREHWWLIDTDGSIVDPTAAQFPSKGGGHYEEWDESRPEPTGMCPECGDYCYDGNTFCCQSHARIYLAYLNAA